MPAIDPCVSRGLATLLCLAGAMLGAPTSAQEVLPQSGEKSTPLDRQSLDSAYDGVIVNQTVTLVGHDFYRAFVAAWRDKPNAERYTLTIVERPTARLGSQIWVEFLRRRVFQAMLPPARARVTGFAEAAVDATYQAVVQSEVQRLLFRDPDLGPEEI